MKIFFFIMLMMSFSAFGQELCQKENSPEVEAQANAVVDILSCLETRDDSNETAMSAAQLFLQKNETGVNFDVGVARKLLARLQKFAESEKLSSKDRSRFWLFIAGIRGKVAEKLRMDGGPQEGKLALESLKKSIQLNDQNKEAALAYAQTIVRITEQNFMIRPFIEKSLKVKIKDEIKQAKETLEKAGLKQHQLYTDLED